jgi:hypothetical protein
MQIANFLLASPSSPFGWSPQPHAAIYEYGDHDWTKGFNAAHRLWREECAG